MYICVYGAASKSIDKCFVDASYKLGQRLAQRGHKLIFGAGSTGVMGATARGVYSQHGEIIGIAPGFFNVDGVLFEHCTRLIRPDTMRERKALLETLSDAFVVAPGGIGTYDEFFEILTLKQLERHTKPIAIYNPNGFYDKLFDFLQYGIDHGIMKEANKKLFGVFTDPDDIIDYLESYVHEELDLTELKDIDLRLEN